MPPIIPGARKSGRPLKSGRKSSARARAFPKNQSNAGDSGSRGAGSRLLAAVAAAVAALITVAVRAHTTERERNRVIRERLRSKPRALSEHAACRMECRFIAPADVERTLVDGAYDARHSSPNAKPCARVALNSGRVRAIWADCREDTRLVTVIDTTTNHPCGPC